MKPSQHEVWQTIGGWYDTRFCDNLYALALATPKDAVIVELGAFNGKSGLAMGLACPGTDRRVWLVDDFSQDACQGVLRENIVRMGLEQHCSVIEGTSWEVGERWEGSVHLLHVDAGHELGEVTEDLRAWLRHVVEAGIVVLHDFDRPGPSGAARKILGEPDEIWINEPGETTVGVYRIGHL